MMKFDNKQFEQGIVSMKSGLEDRNNKITAINVTDIAESQ